MLLLKQREITDHLSQASDSLSWKCCRAFDSCTVVGIRRVPMDVLAEIFLFYLASEPSCSPWTLTAVSRTFRVTAFSTPRLWGHIKITTKKYFRRWIDGSEQCNTLRRLQRALARAAAAPLDIIVNLRTEPAMHYKQQKRATKLLRTLFRTSSRWASLIIDDLSMHDFDFRWIEGNYGSLESLVMASTTPQKLIQAIGRSHPNLTTLRAEGFQIENFISCWSRLTTLFYEAHSRDDNAADRIRILDNITQCTLLRQLRLSMGTLRFTTDEVRLYNSRSLPNLRKLYFANVNCAMLFECPNLTHLSYKTNYRMPPCLTTIVMQDTNEFRLEHLVYCEVRSPFIEQYLVPLVAPNLQDLHIAAVSTYGRTSLGVDVLKSTLKKMEALRILEMSCVEIAKTAFETFVIEPKDRKRSILCPKLVRLNVEVPIPKDGDLKPILKEVAESRRIAGIPLKSLRYRSLGETVDLCQN